MGMRLEGNSEFGLLIPDKELAEFIQKYNHAHPEDAFEDVSDLDAYDTLIGCEKPFMVLYLNSDYAGIDILPINGGGWYPAGEGLLIFAEKSTAANQLLKHGFYGSAEEICEEFKVKVGAYLPQDFEYESHIGDITYAVYC